MYYICIQLTCVVVYQTCKNNVFFLSYVSIVLYTKTKRLVLSGPVLDNRTAHYVSSTSGHWPLHVVYKLDGCLTVTQWTSNLKSSHDYKIPMWLYFCMHVSLSLYAFCQTFVVSSNQGQHYQQCEMSSCTGWGTFGGQAQLFLMYLYDTI